MVFKDKKEAIAIIPARGGSKGIPRKNIVDLCGMPLIAYTIRAALNAELVTRVVVSTDDEEIAEISKKWGAEVPFLRPKELSNDTACIGDAITYTISNLGVESSEIACIELYPTSPFRPPGFIDQMISILYQGYSSIRTVKEILIDHNFLFVKSEQSSFYEMINLIGKNNFIPKWKKYYRTYPVFIAHLYQKKERHYYHVLSDPCMLIDIDTPHDLRWAEAVIKRGLFDFGFKKC